MQLCKYFTHFTFSILTFFTKIQHCPIEPCLYAANNSHFLPVENQIQPTGFILMSAKGALQITSPKMMFSRQNIGKYTRHSVS